MSEKLCTLRTKGGGGGKYTETSLWTNSAPTSNFAAQDITLSDSMANYKYLKFRFKVSTSNTTESSCEILVSDLNKSLGGANTPWMLIGTTDSAPSNVYTRKIQKKSDSVINIDAGLARNVVSTNNAYVIPLEILGLNELAHGGNVNPVTIGTKSSLSAQTIDVSQILPNDYQKLTIDNFYIKNAKIAATSSSGSATAITDIISSYNPSTGTLNCNASYWTNGGYRFYINYTISAVY